MNENIKAIREKAIAQAETIEPGNNSVVWDLFIKMLEEECINVVKETGTQCAFTTHDLSMVTCTIAKCAESIENYFKE